MVSPKQNGKSIIIRKKKSPIKGNKLNFEGSSFDRKMVLIILWINTKI